MVFLMGIILHLIHAQVGCSVSAHLAPQVVVLPKSRAHVLRPLDAVQVPVLWPVFSATMVDKVVSFL